MSQHCHCQCCNITIRTIAVTALCSFSLSQRCAHRCLTAVGFLLCTMMISQLIHKHIRTQKTYIFRQLIQTSAQFCSRKIELKQFLKKNYQNKNKLVRTASFIGRAGMLTIFFTWSKCYVFQVGPFIMIITM